MWNFDEEYYLPLDLSLSDVEAKLIICIISGIL